LENNDEIIEKQPLSKDEYIQKIKEIEKEFLELSTKMFQLTRDYFGEELDIPPDQKNIPFSHWSYPNALQSVAGNMIFAGAEFLDQTRGLPCMGQKGYKNSYTYRLRKAMKYTHP
jgi:hypothetical protein